MNEMKTLSDRIGTMYSTPGRPLRWVDSVSSLGDRVAEAWAPAKGGTIHLLVCERAWSIRTPAGHDGGAYGRHERSHEDAKARWNFYTQLAAWTVPEWYADIHYWLPTWQ